MAPRSDEGELQLRIVCRAAPPEEHEGALTEFGLQDTNRVLHPGDAVAEGGRRFACTVRLRRRADDGLDFGGPFVHGPAGARFLYFGLRPVGAEAWIRRYKITLQSIDWDLVAAAHAQADGGLAAHVALSNAVPVLFAEDGWALATVSG